MRTRFIKYLLVLYLALMSTILVNPNPLFALPLVLVLISLMFDQRWIGMAGVLAYTVLTFKDTTEILYLSDVSLNNIFSIIIFTILVLLPLVAILEIVLFPRPYRIERISLGPLLISMGLAIGMLITIFILSRVQMIGVYLESDPMLQVFILMSSAIFLFAPPLLSRSGKDPNGPKERSHLSQVDKNE